jgi:glycosyltransferase involved in cell wall biosynthesis
MDQARKMRKFEDAAAARYDGLVAVSDRDARHFRSLVGEKRVHIIPTGVDLDYFQFAPADRIVPANGGTLVFTGSMDWRANVDGIRFFMDAVWPQIASARPQARMIVVGHSPPRDLVAAVRDRRLAWEFTGFVDDVRTRMREADLYVIPLRVGGGTRIKAFEAMAMGRPVVSTSLGVEGLPVEHGTHCVIADSAPALARAILDLFADAPARSEIARRARALLDERFSFRAAAAVFEEACIRTVDARHGMQMRPLRSRRS